MPLTEALARIDTAAARMERLWSILRWIATLIIAGVLWGARLEWRSSATADDVSAMKPVVSEHGQKLANIEGRLHGIASQVGKVPSKVAARLNGEEAER